MSYLTLNNVLIFITIIIITFIASRLIAKFFKSEEDNLKEAEIYAEICETIDGAKIMLSEEDKIRIKNEAKICMKMKKHNYYQADTDLKEAVIFGREKMQIDYFMPICTEEEPPPEYQIIHKNYFSNIYDISRTKSYDDEICSENFVNELKIEVLEFMVLNSVSRTESKKYYIHVKIKFENSKTQKSLIYFDIYKKTK